MDQTSSPATSLSCTSSGSFRERHHLRHPRPGQALPTGDAGSVHHPRGDLLLPGSGKLEGCCRLISTDRSALWARFHGPPNLGPQRPPKGDPGLQRLPRPAVCDRDREGSNARKSDPSWGRLSRSSIEGFDDRYSSSLPAGLIKRVVSSDPGFASPRDRSPRRTHGLGGRGACRTRPPP